MTVTFFGGRMDQVMTQSTALMAALAGSALGLMFFGGQWWTARLCLSHPHRSFWFFMSFLLRTGLAINGFFWFGMQSWQLLIFCLIGFVGAYGLVRVMASVVGPVEPSGSNARPPAKKKAQPDLAQDSLPQLLPARPGKLARAEKQMRKELQAQAVQRERRARSERRNQADRRNQTDRRTQANRRGFPDRRARPDRRGQPDRRNMVHG
jgi:F1F0 ATPase subunit 2